MFLNLHTHSVYSDGSDDIVTLAEAFKAQNHAALVLTDHDGFVEPISLKLWDIMKQDAEQASNKFDGYPIVLGLEVYVPGASEECLLFGDKACQEWLSLVESNDNGIRLPAVKSWIRSMRERDISFAMVLCHPGLRCIDSAFYGLLDGYEIMNAGQMWPDDMIDRMKLLMPKAKPFKNLDLHSITDIDPLCNEITSDEAKAIFKPYDNKGNLERLIKWIKS